MGCFLSEDYGYFEYKSLLNYNTSKLPSKFVYKYDTGEGYKFDCKIYKKKVNYNSTKDFIL